MIDLSLSALIKAWITTTATSGLLLVALALAQVWNNDAYLQGLRQALQITAEEPPPDVLGLYAKDSAEAYMARARHTGS
jgi:hypothetical protein